MSKSKRTTDHAEIRKWAEARQGTPARVQGTGESDDAGLLRIDFPERESEQDDDDELEEITWDEFFEKFDEKRLAFVYQEQTAAGQQSRFNRFVSR
ncbi:MAG TPA: hypothetical protein VM692_13915 [Gammaproteobacteria bacterium]|nr:hypothetical protein [Gammaproteobacteria bacterium]